MGSQVGNQLLPGATPVADDEQGGLIPSIQTRAELNQLEAANIDIAVVATRRLRPTSALRRVTEVQGLLNLHGLMFGEVWRWAGQVRRTDKNIGAPKEQVRERLKALCDDVAFQIEHKTYDPDEVAVRFHHRLVSIHPFANGNGRHARLAADVLITAMGGKPFQWGGRSLTSRGPIRARYLEALRGADAGDITQLLVFARSSDGSNRP
jgi:Fic-DOC domain mobile mystery protein B